MRLRYATPPGRVKPQPPSLQLLSDKMTISVSSSITASVSICEDFAPDWPSEDAYESDAPKLLSDQRKGLVAFIRVGNLRRSSISCTRYSIHTAKMVQECETLCSTAFRVVVKLDASSSHYSGVMKLRCLMKCLWTKKVLA